MCIKIENETVLAFNKIKSFFILDDEKIKNKFKPQESDKILVSKIHTFFNNEFSFKHLK